MIKHGLTYRIILRRLSMLLPYLLCLKIFIENSESLYALINNLWIQIDGNEFQYTPISWSMSNYISYNWLVVLCIYILSYAFEFCWKHRIVIYYLGFNLIEKQVIENYGIDDNMIPCYLGINMIIIILILIIGIGQWYKNKKHLHHE